MHQKFTNQSMISILSVATLKVLSSFISIHTWYEAMHWTVRFTAKRDENKITHVFKSRDVMSVTVGDFFSVVPAIRTE